MLYIVLFYHLLEIMASELDDVAITTSTASKRSRNNRIRMTDNNISFSYSKLQPLLADNSEADAKSEISSDEDGVNELKLQHRSH